MQHRFFVRCRSGRVSCRLVMFLLTEVGVRMWLYVTMHECSALYCCASSLLLRVLRRRHMALLRWSRHEQLAGGSPPLQLTNAAGAAARPCNASEGLACTLHWRQDCDAGKHTRALLHCLLLPQLVATAATHMHRKAPVLHDPPHPHIRHQGQRHAHHWWD